MKTGKKILLILTQILAVAGFVFFASDKAEARELTGTFSDVNIWRTNFQPVTPTNGVHELIEGEPYTFQVDVDLSSSGNVADGDYFVFNIPAPYTVKDETFDLTDTDTGIAVGSAVVTSSGQGQGGSVTITLKNIPAYLEQKQAQEAVGIKGTFYVDFSATETSDAVTTTFTNIKDSGTKNLVIDVAPRYEWPDNSTGLTRENLAKYAGVLTNRPYDSTTLGKSGQWQHPWALRINASRKSYNSLTITDKIDQSSESQFIPETLEIHATETGFSFNYAIQNPITLTEGTDYTVSYADNYKSMVVTILNPGDRAFYMTYGTTSPTNGLLVGNQVELSSNGTAIPISDDSSETVFSESRQSLITQGGTIQLDIASRITVQKVDADTGEPLSGAVFKVTKPDGTEITLDPTDSNGFAQTSSFSAAEMAAGTYTITEVTAPEGYEIDNTPREVTVTPAGVVEKFTNKSKSIVNPPSGPSDSSSSTSGSGSDSSSSTSTSDSTDESSIVNPPTLPSSGGGTGGDTTPGGGTGTNGDTAIGQTDAANGGGGSRKVLPRTGERSATWILAAGIVLTAIAGGLLLAKRRKG